MLTDVNEIDQKTLAKIADFTIKSGGNLMTFGPAGVGKTEIAMQAAQIASRKCVYLNLSVLEAPELLGLPMIDETDIEVDGQRVKSRVATYAPPAYLPLYNPKVEPVVLLVDEVDKAKPELQNPMLELFQFRSMNGRKMNISSVIATGNLPDENAFSQPVSWALTNRCSVYKVQCAFEPWQEWAASANVNPLVVGFLSRHTDYLLKPSTSGDSTAYCNPSPRSWILAARDLDHTTKNNSVDFQTLLIGGRVGQGAAIKFKVWLEHYRFIEPYIDRLVKNGEHPGGEAIKDHARVIVCAIAGANAMMQEMKKTPTDEKEKDKQLKEVARITKNVCGWMQHLSSDICIAACKSVFTMKAIQEYKLTKIPEFMATFVKVRQAMKDPDA